MKKHIVCFGDSNTHGYCADPNDCADPCACPECGLRFNESERWTMLLQDLLESEFHVIEEGLCGRTTVFDDPFGECLSGMDSIVPCLMSHQPVDLLVIMLGTNDTKERFSLSPRGIASGLEQLICKAKSLPVWKAVPNILIIAPPHIKDGIRNHQFFSSMGSDSIAKSSQLAPLYKELCIEQGCAFLDAEGVAEFNEIDCMHLTRKGHSQLAQALSTIVKDLVK